MGEPIQAVHLCVDTIVSKLHNEEGHLIIEEEFKDHRDIHEIQDQEVPETLVAVPVDIKQPKPTHTTNTSEGEDIVAPTLQNEAHEKPHHSATILNNMENQLPLGHNQPASSAELKHHHHQAEPRLINPSINESHDQEKGRDASSSSHDATTSITQIVVPQPSIKAPALPAYTPRSVQIDQSLTAIDIPTLKQLIASTKDMKETLEADDKNTESSWKQRFSDLNLLRAITKGNAPTDLQQSYNELIKVLFPGILKCVNSPRTVLSSLGCTLLQEMAVKLNSNIDPHVEIILSETIKLCGSTKKIISENGGVTVDVIFAYVSYNGRYFRLLSNACEDKNSQTRVFAAIWLKTIVSRHQLKIEHTGYLDTTIKCITKGLDDANPSVRDHMRSTFWTFSRVWPQHGATIYQKCDTRSKTRVMKDSESFKLIEDTLASPAGRPTSQRGITESSRSLALRQTIRAAKRPVTAGNAETRPKPKTSSSEAEATSHSNRPASAMSLSKPAAPASRTFRPALSRPTSAMSAPKGKAAESNDEGPGVPSLRSAPMRFASKQSGSTKTAKSTPAVAAGPRRIYDKRSNDDMSHKDKGTSLVEAEEHRDPHTEVGNQGANSENEAPNVAATEAVDENHIAAVDVVPENDTDGDHVNKNHVGDKEYEQNETLSDTMLPPTHDEPESSQAPVERQNIINRRLSGIPKPIRVYQDPQVDESPATPGSAKVLKPKQPQAYYHSRYAATPWMPVDVLDDNEELIPPSPLQGAAKLTEKDQRVSEQAKRLWERKNTIELRVVTPLNRDPAYLENQLNQAIQGLIDRGMDTRGMSGHGYHRIHGIIRELGGLSDNIYYVDGVFNVLMSATLECLNHPIRRRDINSLAARAVWSRDTQYLMTLISEVETRAPAYIEAVRVLPALVQLRGTILHHDATVYGIEELITRVFNTIVDPTETLEFTLQAVQGEIEAPEPHHGTVMGLFVMAGLLERLNVFMDEDLKVKLTDFAHSALKNHSPGKEDGETTVSRATVCFLSALGRHFERREEFVRAICKGSEAHVEVLDWYLA